MKSFSWGKTGNQSQSRRNNASSGGRSASSSSTKGPKRSQGELGAQAKNAGPDSSTPIDPLRSQGYSKGAIDTIADCEGAARSSLPGPEDSQKEKESDDRKVAQVLRSWQRKNVRMSDSP
jgi:hypothetical protein